MEAVQTSNAALDAIVLRAENFQKQLLDENYRKTDRAFAIVMGVQWIFAIVVALAISPWAWTGKTQVANIHVYLAVLLGGILSGVPIALTFIMPGSALTRHVMAASQMLWSALLIHLSGGRIETHF